MTSPSEAFRGRATLDQPDSWRDVLARSPIPLDVRPVEADKSRRNDFHASVEVAMLGDVQFGHSRLSAQDLVRTPRLIKAADERFYTVNLRLGGLCQVAVDDRREILRPGEMTLLTSEQRTQLIHPADSQSLAVHFPAHALPVSYEAFASVAGTPLPTDSGVAGLLRGVLLNLGKQLYAPQGPAMPARLAGTVLDLTETLVLERLGSQPPGPAQLRRVLLAQVRQDIEAHLASDELSPTDVAARNHMSKRALHKLFEAEDMTVSAWIREQRLRRVSRDLRDPGLAHLPVAAIAARWGLREPAQFSRMFKARFGVTAREYRRDHLTTSAPAQP